MEEDIKKRIRELLNVLLNFQNRELNEQDIYKLSKIKDELQNYKIGIEKDIQSKIDLGINENEYDYRALNENLTRIKLALENISFIISDSVIILCDKEKSDLNSEYEEIVKSDVNNDDDLWSGERKLKSIENKIEMRKQIKNPIEAFFISSFSATELMENIKKRIEK